MTSPNAKIRRATLDDVTQLTELWKSMRFAPEDLARRITEFQVAEGADGLIAGAVGLNITKRQGRIHSEGFTDFGLADELRPLLWERLQSVATNHGLLRLWTQETAPFWSHCGMVKTDPEALSKMPEEWRGSEANWLTLKLKDDVEEVISADREFARFMESERQRTQRALQHAKVLKAIAVLVALAVFGIVAVGLFMVIHRNQLYHR